MIIIIIKKKILLKRMINKIHKLTKILKKIIIIKIIKINKYNLMKFKVQQINSITKPIYLKLFKI